MVSLAEQMNRLLQAGKHLEDTSRRVQATVTAISQPPFPDFPTVTEGDVCAVLTAAQRYALSFRCTDMFNQEQTYGLNRRTLALYPVQPNPKYFLSHERLCWVEAKTLEDTDYQPGKIYPLPHYLPPE